MYQNAQMPTPPQAMPSQTAVPAHDKAAEALSMRLQSYAQTLREHVMRELIRSGLVSEHNELAVAAQRIFTSLTGDNDNYQVAAKLLATERGTAPIASRKPDKVAPLPPGYLGASDEVAMPKNLQGLATDMGGYREEIATLPGNNPAAGTVR